MISATGQIITNHHVIDGCTGDIKGNLTGGAPAVLRVVSKDAANDLALLQGPADQFKQFARICDRTIRSGDAVTVIGFPLHGLLTSDFTVTTGIVSSLSGIKNDLRMLQISAAVQPGNSGGPLWTSAARSSAWSPPSWMRSHCCAGHRRYPAEYQLRDQDRCDPRFPRQQRRRL